MNQNTFLVLLLGEHKVLVPCYTRSVPSLQAYRLNCVDGLQVNSLIHETHTDMIRIWIQFVVQIRKRCCNMVLRSVMGSLLESRNPPWCVLIALLKCLLRCSGDTEMLFDVFIAVFICFWRNLSCHGELLLVVLHEVFKCFLRCSLWCRDASWNIPCGVEMLLKMFLVSKCFLRCSLWCRNVCSCVQCDVEMPFGVFNGAFWCDDFPCDVEMFVGVFLVVFKILLGVFLLCWKASCGVPWNASWDVPCVFEMFPGAFFAELKCLLGCSLRC